MHKAHERQPCISDLNVCFVLICGCNLDSWSGSHIRWGQSFRLRHLTTGHYLALTEDRGLVLQDRERSDTVATAFCFRASKVRTHAIHTLSSRWSSRWGPAKPHSSSLKSGHQIERMTSVSWQMNHLLPLDGKITYYPGQWKLLDPWKWHSLPLCNYISIYDQRLWAT